MPNYYLPSSDPKLAVWATNFKSQISVHATILHLTPEEVVADQEYCDAITDVIQKVVSLKAQLKAAVKDRNHVLDTKGRKLRARISRYKTEENYTEAIGSSLGIVTPKRSKNPENYYAEISTRISGGQVQICFIKKLADGLNLYYRKKNSDEWQLVSRITKSPFIHEVELETIGQPEKLEYLAYGVIDDVEIGKPSTIVQIVFGG